MVLIIGYGNTLRSDDGVGAHVAREVEAKGWPGVRAIASAQLTPELAADVAQAQQVIFVDADAVGEPHGVRVVELWADANAVGPMTHHATPRGVLALAAALYDRCPPAFLVSIPGVNFALGEGLSPIAAQGAEMALRLIGMRVMEWHTHTNEETHA
jgi:hydrogenase maturation protease